MKDLEKLTKDKLINIIEEQYEKINRCKALEEDIENLRNELELYEYLKQHYVPTMEENKILNNSIEDMRTRIWELQDLCNRQQKIIDSRCN